MTGPSSDAIQEYRKHCVSAEQKAQEDYDKAVLALSGGALGISFAFIKDIVGSGAVTWPGLLLSAWISWGTSVVITLASYWFSQRALREAIRQVDADTIHKQYPGRTYARVTETLNAVGGVLFVVGVIFMVFFVSANIDRVHATEKPRRSKTTVSPGIERILSIGPFAVGDTAPMTGDWKALEGTIAAVLHSRQANGSIDAVMLLGSVDRRPLSPRAALRFGSNMGLATARAEAVRSRVARLVGDSIAVYVIPTGALELARGLREEDLGQDRRVDMYLLSGGFER